MKLHKYMNNTIIEFDYKLEALKNLAKELEGKTDIEDVKEAIKTLVKVRRSIQTKGKKYRDEANAFNKLVLEREKEFISVIEPLEKSYKDIIQQEEEKQKLEARKSLLPFRREQLKAFTEIDQEATDEFLLQFDENAWVDFISKMSEINQSKIDQKAREAQIKKEAEENAEKRMIEEQERKKEEEKKEAERKIIEEKEAQEKIEKNKKYKQFLDDNNFNASTDIIKRDENHFIIYRKVSEITIN